MPYKTIDELPNEVRHALPQHAQRIYMAAHNAAMEQHKGEDDAEGTAARIAWAAVKTKYTLGPRGGMWVAKEADADMSAAAGTQRIREAITKTEDGKAYPAADFAYVPDLEKPSTWKLRLTEEPGKVTMAMLGAAASAFSPGGHRGKKVELPPDAVGKVKARIRAEYAKLGVKAEAVPASVREGFAVATPLPQEAPEPPDPLTFDGEQKRAKAEETASKLSDLAWTLNRVLRNILCAALSSTDKQGLITKACADFQARVATELPADVAAAAEVVRERMAEALREVGDGGMAGANGGGLESPPHGTAGGHVGPPLRTATADGHVGPPPRTAGAMNGAPTGAVRGIEARVQEWFPANSVEPLGDGDYRVEFIAHGTTQDGKRYYPKDTLQRAAEAGRFDGAKMFLNHSDPAADARRGHRDMRDFVAVIKAGTVRMSETGIQAVAHAHDAQVRSMLDDPVAKSVVGLSHDSTVKLRSKTIDGRAVQVVESIEACHSVDFVPSGNAHGRVLEAAPDNHQEVSDMDAQELQELVDAQIAEIKASTAAEFAEIKEMLAEMKAGTREHESTGAGETAGGVQPMTDAQVKEAVNRETQPLRDEIKRLTDERAAIKTMEQIARLVEAREDISPAARARVLAGFSGEIIATDQLAARVTEACDKERDYALEILGEAGVRTQVRGLGSAPPEQVKQTQEAYDAELRARLEEQGYGAEEIEKLVKAR